MPIRKSSARQIAPLIQDLSSANAVARDAAVARLIVIGGRAVERVCAVASEHAMTAETRLAALRALEGIGDARALPVALDATSSTTVALAIAGIALLRRLIASPKETAAIEALTAISLDTGRAPGVRIAAVQALSALGAATVTPLWKRLESDPDPDLRAWVASRRVARPRATAGNAAADAHLASVDAMVERGLPDDPVAVRLAISREGPKTPLIALKRMVEAIHEREDAAPARHKLEWASARAAVHAALANRASRIALYDLRDSLAAATGPLPVEFLMAITNIGDASCLEPLAAAYAKSTRSGENWWREHLRHAFHTIVTRERITSRHAAMKKVLARWPAIVR